VHSTTVMHPLTFDIADVMLDDTWVPFCALGQPFFISLCMGLYPKCTKKNSLNAFIYPVVKNIFRRVVHN
jgi:hypothetical protein